MSETNSVVAIYDTHTQAEEAVKELQRSGFDMKKMSIVGKDYHTDEHVVGYYNTGDRMKYWGKLGAFWGGLWGMLFGAAAFAIPGVGPVLVAGPLVAWIVGALEGAVVVGGMGNIWGGLIGVLLLTFLPPVIQALPQWLPGLPSGLQNFSNYELVLYGLLLILFMMFLPKGVADGLGRAADFTEVRARRLGDRRKAKRLEGR